MNTRQKIRAIITLLMVATCIILAFVGKIEALKELILPLTIVLGGYFSVESIKNIKKP